MSLFLLFTSCLTLECEFVALLGAVQGLAWCLLDLRSVSGGYAAFGRINGKGLREAMRIAYSSIEDLGKWGGDDMTRQGSAPHDTLEVSV